MSYLQVLLKIHIVNAVAPGPIYTPLIPATFDEEKVENQGGGTPMGFLFIKCCRNQWCVDWPWCYCIHTNIFLH
jgi:hypothetical protein